MIIASGDLYNMCGFQQCGNLTSIDSDKPLQSVFKLRTPSRCFDNTWQVYNYTKSRQSVSCKNCNSSFSLLIRVTFIE